MPIEKFKTENCKVLSYNVTTKELDIDFCGFGIRLYEINKDIGETVDIKYRGKIGTSNFECKL